MAPPRPPRRVVLHKSQAREPSGTRMRIAPPTILVLLLAGVLSGCTAPAPSQDAPAPPSPGLLQTLDGFAPLPKSLAPIFGAPLLVDDVRAGGEPVIAVTHKGTLLIGSHPGFTHYHPGSDPSAVVGLVEPFAGESYIFRSTDNGTSWSTIGTPGAGGIGPRSAGLGVSDPEFTVMDLEALAAASVSCSTDDGLTWTGNPVASGQPVDRQWLASYKDQLYFTANPQGLASADFRVSTDRGLTWTDLGTTPCNSDVIANPANGHLYQSCDGLAMTVSTDGGKTWGEPVGPKDAKDSGLALNEPALDSAGNIWLAWSEGEQSLHVAGTPDEGATWPWHLDLTPHFALASRVGLICGQEGAPANCTQEYTNMPGGHQPPAHNGTFVWPWVSAGSAGRVAVTWIGTYDFQASESNSGPWYVFSAFVINATTPSPTVVINRLTPDPMHDGPICQQGTQGEVGSVQGDAGSDRRLGDFFETTIEPGTGYLLATSSNTATHPNDVIGHPQFVRQTGGIRLIAEGEQGSFRPTQG